MIQQNKFLQNQTEQPHHWHQAQMQWSINVYPSTNPSVETTAITLLVTMTKDFFFLWNPSPGSHWETRSLSLSLPVTLGVHHVFNKLLFSRLQTPVYVSLDFNVCRQMDLFSPVAELVDGELKLEMEP